MPALLTPLQGRHATVCNIWAKAPCTDGMAEMGSMYVLEYIYIYIYMCVCLSVGLPARRTEDVGLRHLDQLDLAFHRFEQTTTTLLSMLDARDRVCSQYSQHSARALFPPEAGSPQVATSASQHEL